MRSSSFSIAKRRFVFGRDCSGAFLCSSWRGSMRNLLSGMGLVTDSIGPSGITHRCSTRDTAAWRHRAPPRSESAGRLAAVAGGTISMSMAPIGSATNVWRDPLLELHDLEAGLPFVLALFQRLFQKFFVRFHGEPPFGDGTGNERRRCDRRGREGDPNCVS